MGPHTVKPGPREEALQRERILERLRIGAMVTMVATVSIGMAAAIYSPHGIWPLGLVRLGTVAVMLATLWYARRPSLARHYALVVAVPVLWIAVDLSLSVHYEGGADSPFFALVCLLLGTGGALLAMPPRAFAPLAAMVVAISVVPIAFAEPVALSFRFFTVCLFAAVAAVIGTIAGWLVRGIELRELAGQTRIEAINRRLEEMDRAKTEFFEDISHDLRTSLTLNLAPLQVLARGDAGPLTPEQQRLVALMRSNGEVLHRLVNDLLELARLDAGRFEPRRMPVALAEAVERTAAQFAESFKQKGLRFTVEPGRRDLTVLLDLDVLTRVLSNLLSNALKFTDAGAVRLEVAERATATGDAREIEIAVSDTGIGLSDEERARLFERFQRGTRSAAGRGGSGIGLAMAKKFLEAEGGRIACESACARGTTFRVTLPLRPVALPAPAAEAAAAPPVPAPATVAGAVPLALDRARAGGFGKGRDRVLLVEDDRELSDFLVTLLARRYQVGWAGDGAAGLACARTTPPDVIVADVVMPRMTGLELCRALQADSKLAEIPVILLTARTETADQLAGYESGAVDYLAKPFDPDVLESKIAALIRIRKLKEELVARERLAAIGEVTITLSHEINNALTGVIGSAQILASEPLPESSLKLVRTTIEEARRVARTVARLGSLREAETAAYLPGTNMIRLE